METSSSKKRGRKKKSETNKTIESDLEEKFEESPITEETVVIQTQAPSKIIIDEYGEIPKVKSSLNPPYINTPITDEKGRKIDTGKIRALRRAGWSVEDIADDMDIEEDQLKEYMRKMGLH